MDDDLAKHVAFPGPGPFRSFGPWNTGIKVSGQHPDFRVVVEGPAKALSMSTEEARRYAKCILDEADAADKDRQNPCVECAGANAEERYGWKCHTCKFWLEHIARSDGKAFVADGHHYRIGIQGPSAHPSCRGFGGSKALVTYLADGRIVETVDLWYQGEIPKRFLDRLPNTATFKWAR